MCRNSRSIIKLTGGHLFWLGGGGVKLAENFLVSLSAHNYCSSWFVADIIIIIIWDRERARTGICRGGWWSHAEDQVIASPAAKGRLRWIADEETLFIRLDRGNFRVVVEYVARQCFWWGWWRCWWCSDDRDRCRLGTDREAALEAVVNIPGNQESASKSIM